VGVPAAAADLRFVFSYQERFMSVELIPHDDPYADIVFADPRPQFVNVTIGGDRYRLREVLEGAYLDYEAGRAKGAKLEDGALTGMGSAVLADAALLSSSLFKVNGGPESAVEERVTEAWVRKLPARVAKPLVDRLKIISGISDLESADQLRRRIAADTKKLEKLESGKAGDTGPKGSGSGSPGTSASPPSAGADSGNSSGGTAGNDF
jgi:hypothetical protein